MPATLEAYQLTDAYRRQLLRLRQQTVLTAQAAWRLYVAAPTDAGQDLNLDARIASYVAATAPVVVGAQRVAARLSNGYVGQYAQAETGNGSTPTLDPDQFADRTSYGLPIAAALTGGIITTRMALRGGKTFDQASAMGFARSGRVIGAATLFAGRSAVGALMMAMDNVNGYQRALGDNPCGACMALADGTVLPADVDMEIHDNCRCVPEPVMNGVNADRFARPTGQQLFDRLDPGQQDALFAGRGGAAKADLIRSGAVPIGALLAHVHQEYGPDQITETPLADLTTSTNR